MMDKERVAEKIVQKMGESVSETRIHRIEKIEPVHFPSYEAIYGVPIYVIGEGYAGQVRRFFIARTNNGNKWIFELSPSIIIYGVRSETYIPVVVLGIPTPYALQKFEHYVVDEAMPFRTLECDERDIINLERVLKGEDCILLIDKYELYRRGVGQEYWYKFVEMQNMIANMQEMIYELEHERSELLTNLRMRETEVQVLRDEIEHLRSQLVKLRSEAQQYYLEYLRLKSETKLQGEVSDLFESLFNRLSAFLRTIEKSFNDKLSQIQEELMRAKEKVEKEEKEEEGKKEVEEGEHEGKRGWWTR